MSKIKDKIFILTNKECPPCKKLTRHLDKKVPLYDIAESDEAFALAKQGIIDAVPAAVEYDGKKYQKCKIGKSEDGKTIVIECPNSRLEIETKN